MKPEQTLHLIPNWRAVLRYAWSGRHNSLAMIFIAAETALAVIEACPHRHFVGRAGGTLHRPAHCAI